MATELHPEGPHSPDYTSEVGSVLAEAVRVLNYATRDDAPGLQYPGDAYTLLGDLYTATGRLPQLLGQIRVFLDGWQASGQLGAAGAADATEQVSQAAASLTTAANFASSLTTVLQNAQNAISGLYVREAVTGAE